MQRATLWITLTVLAPAAAAEVADFDQLPEGNHGPVLVADGITFSNLDDGLGGTPHFHVDQADLNLAGQPGFTPTNALAFLPTAPGPQASFTRVLSFEMTIGQPANHASVYVYTLGAPVGNFVGLEALSASGATIASDSSSFTAGPGIKVHFLEVSAPAFDRVRLRGFGPTDGGAFLGLVDHVVIDGPGIGAPFCPGDGSFLACPCANDGSPARGCDNSAGTGGATLDASGSTSPDTVVLVASAEVPGAPTIFLQGDVRFAQPAVFGDGVRCIGGALKRLYSTSADASGAATAPGAGGPSITQRSAALGDPIVPWTTRWYQAWYLDPDPSFCPAPAGNTWNSTTALPITW